MAAEALDAAQRAAYRRDGVLFPAARLPAADTAAFRAAFDRLAAAFDGRPRAELTSQCHLNLRWAYDLATHPAILDAVEEVIGRDILIHSSTIFFKAPRDRSFVSWHQDSYFWGLSAPRLTSAWVALSDSAVDNGCLRVVPGSHRRDRVRHRTTAAKPGNLLSSGLEVELAIDPEQVVDVTLAPGELSLHHANIVHGSNPNHSDRPRIGFAVRYLDSSVTQTLPHHAVVVARGRRDIASFEVAERPPRRPFADELAAQADFAERLRALRQRQGRREVG